VEGRHPLPVTVVFTAMPPVSESSFSFRLALFVLLILDGRLAFVKPPLTIEELDDEETLNTLLVVVAIANTSKIEDHILGIGEIFHDRFEGDSNKSSFPPDFCFVQIGISVAISALPKN